MRRLTLLGAIDVLESFLMLSLASREATQLTSFKNRCATSSIAHTRRVCLELMLIGRARSRQAILCPLALPKSNF